MNPKNIESTENEKALRYFYDEGKEESLHKVLKTTSHDAPGQGFDRLLQVTCRRIWNPLSNSNQPVSQRLRGKREKTGFRVEIENHDKAPQTDSQKATPFACR